MTESIVQKRIYIYPAYIHRAYTYLFTTKHNEIDTVVASSPRNALNFFLVLSS